MAYITNLLQKKNTKIKIEYICKNAPECNWRVYARRNPNDPTARLKKLQPHHKCQANESGYNDLANAKWVAGVVEDSIRNHKGFRPKNIAAEVWQRRGVKITYWVAYNAKISCMEKLYEKYDLNYKLLPVMCTKIIDKNPGSIAEWFRNPTDKSFVGLCIAYKASLDGFISGCRPLIGLDACHLKGKYGGMMMSAIALDGNNSLFPIGNYICQSETHENWADFLKLLKPHILKHKDRLTFMSDRCKGLLTAVSEVFPNSPHRFCFRHMYKNFKKEFGRVEMRHLSWSASSSFVVEEYEAAMKRILAENTAAHIWLCNVDKIAWVRAFFHLTCKSEHCTNNFSESFNNMIMDLRDFPIVKLVERYELMVMNLLYQRRKRGRIELCMHKVVPRVEELVEKTKKWVRHYTIAASTDWLQVARNKEGNTWTVDTRARRCSCGVWQLTGIPCVHALGVILPMRHQ